ncbi:MAG: methyltransferase domain-containing protein [Phycisphaerales bacterium]
MTQSLAIQVHRADPSMRSLRAAIDRADEWQRVYNRVVSEESSIVGGRILDIGAGVHPPTLDLIREPMTRAAQWDGVEPDPDVKDHPLLNQRWVGLLEQRIDDIPQAAYDAAFECFVVEHVSDPRAHLTAIARVLKPGAALFGYTPNWTHPFAMMSRAIELIGFKRWFVKHGTSEVNDYPAYYRLNTPARLARAARGLGYERLDVWYVPSAHWRLHFPMPLRLAPLAYEAVLGTKVSSLNQMLLFRLRKAGPAPDRAR